MKKIIILFIFSTFLLGCDTTENDIPTVSIVGAWIGTGIDFTGTAQTEVQGIPVTANLVGEGDTLNFTYTLTENPNLATSEGSYNMEVTASILLQSQTEYRENIPANFSGPWEQNGDTLTLTFEGEEVIANIVALTETTLTLQFAVIKTELVNGFEATVTLDVLISFSR